MKRNDDLSVALRKLRDLEPPPDFMARVRADLAEAARHEHEPTRARRFADWITHHGRLAIPAVASLAIAMHVVVHEPAPVIDAPSVSEHEVELPDDGHGSLDFSLALHHHDTKFVDVRVDLPHGVHLMHSDDVIGDPSPPSCRTAGCVYEFVHPTDSDEPHVRVSVAEPGRYQMHVEHESPSGRVREVFVIHAKR